MKLAGTLEGLKIFLKQSLFFRSDPKNCRDPTESFKDDPSVLATFSNGRLGNQMSAFSTIYGFSKMSGNYLRIGMTYEQLTTLSNIFPYFEENFDTYYINSWYCGHICDLNWKHLKIRVPVNLEKFKEKLKQRFGKSHGKAFYLRSYINIPYIYMQYYRSIPDDIVVPLIILMLLLFY